MSFKEQFFPRFGLEFGDTKIQFQENFVGNAFASQDVELRLPFQVKFAIYLFLVRFRNDFCGNFEC